MIDTAEPPAGWYVFFLSAAAFNAAVGLMLVLTPSLFYELTSLDSPSQFLEARIIGWLILIFGAAYIVIAREPQRTRPFVALMGFGKLGVVAMIFAYFWAGAINALGAVLAAGDLLWAIGFLYMAGAAK